MSVSATAATLAKGALWRATGSHRLAASLIRTAIHGGEDSATAAAMMLTKGGSLAIGPVSEAILEGEVQLVGILVGIGSDEARNALVLLSQSADQMVSEAALRGIERIDRAKNR
jgi:hypothetical protein